MLVQQLSILHPSFVEHSPTSVRRWIDIILNIHPTCIQCWSNNFPSTIQHSPTSVKRWSDVTYIHPTFIQCWSNNFPSSIRHMSNILQRRYNVGLTSLSTNIQHEQNVVETFFHCYNPTGTTTLRTYFPVIHYSN